MDGPSSRVPSGLLLQCLQSFGCQAAADGIRSLSPTHPWVNGFVCIGDGKATFATEYGERMSFIFVYIDMTPTSCSHTLYSFTNSHVFVQGTSKRVSTFSESCKQSSLPLLVLINHREMIFFHCNDEPLQVHREQHATII